MAVELVKKGMLESGIVRLNLRGTWEEVENIWDDSSREDLWSNTERS